MDVVVAVADLDDLSGTKVLLENELFLTLIELLDGTLFGLFELPLDALATVIGVEAIVLPRLFPLLAGFKEEFVELDIEPCWLFINLDELGSKEG